MIKVTFEDGTSELRAPDSKVDVDEAFDSELRFYRGETVRVWRGGERVKVLVEAENVGGDEMAAR